MLYVYGKNGYSRVWHVGEDLPRIDTGDITGIQADGDELDLIRKQWPHLTPQGFPRVVDWPAPYALLIWMNLPAGAKALHGG